MAPLLTVVPLLALTATAALGMMAGVTFLLLPATWPRKKRWLVATSAALAALLILLLVIFRAGLRG